MGSAAEPVSNYPPPGLEVRLFQRHLDLTGKRILEIGCGDGRLTREIAPLAASVLAIEPDPALVADARRLTAEADITNVRYRVGSAVDLRVAAGETFDVAFFSWSL